MVAVTPVRSHERSTLIALVSAFAVSYGLTAVFRHRHFGSGFDLALFDQVLWHVSRFDAPASTIRGYANILGDHFDPAIVIFTPLYWVFTSVEALLIAQAVVLAASILPVYVFLRRRLTPAAATMLAAAYGAFWGLQRTAWFDFHGLSIAPLVIATAILALDTGRRAWFWTCMLVLVFVKEDMIPLVTAFGAWLIYRREWRAGAALVVASVTVFLFVLLVVIPWFSGTETWGYGGAYRTFTDAPWKLPWLLVTPAGKMTTIVLWLAPFLFLPLGSPLVALAIPVAAERLLSEVPAHWGFGFHYSAPLAPILAMAAGDGLARIVRARENPRGQARLLTWCPAASLVLSLVLPGHQPLLRNFSPRHYAPVAGEATGRRALATIPPDASVVAQAAIAPHLSRRTGIFILDEKAPDADFVIASEALNPWPLETDGLQALVRSRQDRGYATVFAEDGWIVLRR